MSANDVCSILSKYGIEVSESFAKKIPVTSYADEHKDEQNLIPMRY